MRWLLPALTRERALAATSLCTVCCAAQEVALGLDRQCMQHSLAVVVQCEQRGAEFVLSVSVPL